MADRPPDQPTDEPTGQPTCRRTDRVIHREVTLSKNEYKIFVFCHGVLIFNLEINIPPMFCLQIKPALLIFSHLLMPSSSLKIVIHGQTFHFYSKLM